MSDKSVLVRLLALGFIVAAGLPSPARAQTASAPVQTRWVSQDIGLQIPATPVHFDNDRLTISAGAGKPGAADQFRFVYQMLSGDVKITARLDSLTPAHLWSNAGLMIRSSLEPDAAHAAIMLRGDSARALQTRTEKGGLTTSRGSKLESGGAPQWLGLERAGSRVTAYASPDGSTWTAIGSESIELGADVYVGIAVSSDGAGQSASAQLSAAGGRRFTGRHAAPQHRWGGHRRDRVALGRHVRSHRPRRHRRGHPRSTSLCLPADAGRLRHRRSSRLRGRGRERRRDDSRVACRGLAPRVASRLGKQRLRVRPPHRNRRARRTHRQRPGRRFRPG